MKPQKKGKMLNYLIKVAARTYGPVADLVMSYVEAPASEWTPRTAGAELVHEGKKI